MSEVLEAPAATGEAPAATDAAAPRRGAGGARWRVSLRLARRQVRRAWVSSVLVTVLIALPIAGMAGFLVYSASGIATPQERVTVELGRMQAWIAPLGVPGAGFWQVPDQPDWNGYPLEPNGAMTYPEGAPVDDPAGALPAGTESILLSSGAVAVETREGSAMLPTWAGPAWDARFAGAFDLVDGARPGSAREAMVTPSALERLGIAIGDELRLADAGDAYTVVGTLDAATLPDREAAVFLPGAAADLVGGDRRWYLPERELAWADVQRLNEDGVVALSRGIVLDPPPFENRFYQGSDSWSTMWSLVLAMSVAALFAGYVVVMLAGAAFAVAARRQQRALAVAASVGADRRDLSRTILLQGAALGVVGGLAGVIAGVGLAALVMALTDDGSATQFWGFHVPWQGLAGVLVFAIAVGTASAWMPARTVARTDALQALRGARRPQKPVASRPVWGSILLVLGVAITILSALAYAAITASNAILWDNPLRYVPAYGIVVGPVLAQFGILLSGRWLLWVSSRALSHAGMAARLASRDAAANASRTVPAFAAIAATVFLGVFAVGVSSMQSAQTARTWFYDAPVGSISVAWWPGPSSTVGVLSPEAAADASATAVLLAEDAGAEAAAVVARQVGGYPSADQVPDDVTFALAILPERYLVDPEVQGTYTSTGQDPRNPISVIAADEVATALGVELSASELAAYRDGAAIVADGRFAADGTIEIQTFTGADVYEGRVPDNVWIRRPDQPRLAAPVRTEALDAIVVEAPLQPVSIAVAPATADRLGVVSQPERVVARAPEQLSVDERDRLRAQGQLRSTTGYTFNAYVVEGPPSDAAWLVPLLGAVSALVLGASAVALGLARYERRPDDATLSAVGATRALRRRVGFWQGLIIAGFGVVAGAAAGILPPIGFSIQSRGMQQLADIPWWLLAALVVLLPLAIAVVSWLVPPRRPDLTRRTAIT